MSKTNQLHTQCLYQDLSYGSSLGTACTVSGSTASGGVPQNEVVIINVDDDDDELYREYEKLAESIEDTKLDTTNTQRAIPYFICEQYCSNDITCVGFVPDYEYGQEISSAFSFNSQQQIEYDSVRCVIARGSSSSSSNGTTITNGQPNGTIMDSTNGLTIPAPCYTKLHDMCIQPNEATIERSSDICDTCNSLQSSNENETCFWCEPERTNRFVTSKAQPGKCICQSNFLVSSSSTSSLSSLLLFEQQATICDMLFPHNDGYPIHLSSSTSNNNIDYESSGTTTAMQTSYYNDTIPMDGTESGFQPEEVSSLCRPYIEQYRGTSSSNNGIQTIGGVTVTAGVIVVAVVVSMIISCCICCGLLYLCCFRGRNKPNRPNTTSQQQQQQQPPPQPTRPTATSVPYGNGGGSHNNTSTQQTNNVNYTSTNNTTNNTNHHYATTIPVEAVLVVTTAGVAASAAPYNPDLYNHQNNDLEHNSMDIKPINYSFSNIEPIPPPSSSYNPDYTSPNTNNNNHYTNNNDDDEDDVPIAMPPTAATTQQQDNNTNSNNNNTIMVRIVAPCDMDEGYRFGASYEGQQFEIITPTGGLTSGQELIVSIPRISNNNNRRRNEENGNTSGTNTTTATLNNVLPIARPVVD